MDTQAPTSTTHEPLPGWLAPEPLPYYHPTVLQARRELRANRKAIEEIAFESLFEEFLDVICENGLGVTQMFDRDPRGPDLKRFIAWVVRDPKRKELYYEAQAVGAEVCAVEIPMIADAKDSLEDANRSSIRIDSRKWQLKVWNRERFGDVKQIDQTVTINLQDAMQVAQERLDRSRTVDVQARRIE